MNAKPRDKDKNRISVVGMGKLGLCMAAIFANKGYHVVGIDVDEGKVKMINGGVAPFYEPKLSELVSSSVKSRKLKTDVNYEALRNTEVTFVVVPTPSTEDGSYSNFCIETAIRGIAKVLKNKSNYHLVVITSTLLPGTMNNFVKPLLEEVSGKKCGRDFGLCYNPEFIALGDVIDGFVKPDLVLVGQYDERSGQPLSAIYKNVCENDPPMVRISLINAEIAKIAINSYVTMKISFANMLASICERTSGGDVDQVTKAMGLDSRIGYKYLRGALGYGGPCFPRDNRAFSMFARGVGCRAELAEVTDRINLSIPDRIVGIIENLVDPKKDSIAILGLTYKPSTYIVEESQSLSIARALSEKGYKVIVHDPLGLDSAKPFLNDKVHYASSINECLSEGTVFVIATPWEEYNCLSPTDFRQKNKVIVLDCWRLLRDKFKDIRLEDNILYIELGVYSELFRD